MKRIILGFVWRVFLLVGFVHTASCADDDMPRCAALGCPIAPSGNPELWKPCDDAACWCGAPVAQECEP